MLFNFSKFNQMKNFRIAWVFLILFSLIIPFSANSCKDNTPCIIKCDSIWEAHPDAFQYLIFPDSSWLEFELLDSGLIDSFTLKNKYVSFKNNNCVGGLAVCRYIYNVN